jgi:antitoxin component YwqK of YwqJK toxin-antitoxin module
MLRYFSIFCLFLAFTSCAKPTFEKVEGVYENGKPEGINVYEGEGDEAVIIEHREYYENEELRMKGAIDAGKRDGEWVAFYDDGSKWSLSTYDKGIKQGKSKVWFKNGNLRYEGKYLDDQKNGTWDYYDEAGALVKSLEH